MVRVAVFELRQEPLLARAGELLMRPATEAADSSACALKPKKAGMVMMMPQAELGSRTIWRAASAVVDVEVRDVRLSQEAHALGHLPKKGRGRVLFTPWKSTFISELLQNPSAVHRKIGGNQGFLVSRRQTSEASKMLRVTQSVWHCRAWWRASRLRQAIARRTQPQAPD